MSLRFESTLKVGVLGGGQLGRMLIQEATDLGLVLSIIDKAGSPCESLTNQFTVGEITDYDQVMDFGKDKDVLTIEIENVNVEALFDLEKKGVKVYPQPSAIQLIQDKGLQKAFYEKIGVPTAPYRLIEANTALSDHNDFLPFMQKMRKGGYDGKGVTPIKSSNDFQEGFNAPSVLEQFVDLEKELSVIVARNTKGEISCFPLVEQEFNQEANLVEFLFSPAGVDEAIEKKASEIAEKIIRELDMIGLLAVEFFLSKNGELLVNEIAPRPHNSGHQTIEGNYTSQFEQHLRAITGLPLGSTAIIQPSVMVNMLGDKSSKGSPEYEGLETVMEWQGVYPHIYGKLQTKPFRKMGHVTIIHPDLTAAKKTALKVKETIKVVGK